MRVLFVILAVLLIVPAWSGEERLALLAGKPQMIATRVTLDPTDPRRTRVGALTFLGGVSLRSIDPAFGGYSALHVVAEPDGNRFTMLSDGGNVVAFTMGEDWQPRRLRFVNLPAGPGIGWEKRDRDTESMAIDPRPAPSGSVSNSIMRSGAMPAISPGPRRSANPKPWRHGRTMAVPNRWPSCPTDASWSSVKNATCPRGAGAAARRIVCTAVTR